MHNPTAARTRPFGNSKLRLLFSMCRFLSIQDAPAGIVRRKATATVERGATLAIPKPLIGPSGVRHPRRVRELLLAPRELVL